ncbi:unnamed protein product [Clavelina lepadiformis]|uniref:Uncharacterized protein n=1 Tax=Clavelina lepadiformis TaxID=159417 RepID=A0ABP0G1V2_CLALP
MVAGSGAPKVSRLAPLSPKYAQSSREAEAFHQAQIPLMFQKPQSDAVLEQMPKPVCDAAVVQILDHFDTFFEVRFAACAS